MARITDYSSLSQSIQDWTHRADLAPFTDYFIQLAELHIYRDIMAQNMGQGIRAMEATLTGTISAGMVAVPSDYLALKAMQIVNGAATSTLTYKDSQWLYSEYPLRQAAGLPNYVARDGANFVFGPYPDTGYGVSGTYYQQAAALSSTNPVTWMTTLAPDVLLAACMMEVQPFLLDDQKSATWAGMYGAKLTSLVLQDTSEKWSAATMQVQTG